MEHGTVIHGTLLASDLIPAFMSELPGDHRLRRDYEENGYNAADEDDIVAELIDILNALAPEGTYFRNAPRRWFRLWLLANRLYERPFTIVETCANVARLSGVSLPALEDDRLESHNEWHVKMKFSPIARKVCSYTRNETPHVEIRTRARAPGGVPVDVVTSPSWLYPFQYLIRLTGTDGSVAYWSRS